MRLIVGLLTLWALFAMVLAIGASHFLAFGSDSEGPR